MALCLIGRAMTHYVHGNAGGRAIVVSPPGIRRPHVTPSLRESQRDCNRGDGREPIPPSGNAEGHTLPHRPSGNAEGHTLPHRPSGNPKVTPYPLPPPGIPTGFCHEARGCAAEALPRVKSKNINNPNGVVPMVRMGGVCCVCIAWILDIHSGRTPLPHPRTRSHSALVCRTPRRARTAQPLAG